MTWKLTLALLAALSVVGETGPSAPDLAIFPNAAGSLVTFRISGASVDLTGPFFQPLASSGRSCGSCHRPAEGWTISAQEIRSRFEATKGLDPIFRTNDGANCDYGIETSTIAGRRSAYSLLLRRGVIRIALPVPASAQFEVVRVENPYGCGDRSTLSMYRRPLPATNLRLLSTVMWDGRASTTPDLAANLAYQASDAANVHARVSAPLKEKQLKALVHYEMDLATAQAFDRDAGALDTGGASGGPIDLATRTIPAFFKGINDARAGDPHGIKAENAFRLFDAWSKVPYGRVYVEVADSGDVKTDRRESIVRGQVLFDQKPFDIKGVAGLNDDLNLPSITGACGTCHNSPNAGNHSAAGTMNTGVADLDTPNDLPRITLRDKTSHATVVTSDPGRALITGSWKDVGKIKVPVLRGLAARAPYFHNGSASSLADVVEFYDTRFHIGFSAREKADLIAFLSAL